MNRREFVKEIASTAVITSCGLHKSTNSEIISLENGNWLAVVCRADRPNSNGRIYSKETLQQTIKDMKEIVQSRTLLGQISMPENGLIYFNQISHICKSLYLEGNMLKTEIEILNTPEGNNLRKLLKNNEVLFRTAGIGNIDSGVIRNFKLTSINAVPVLQAVAL